MNARITIITSVGVSLALVLGGTTNHVTELAGDLEDVTMILELNDTDGDAEVVMTVDTEDAFKRLQVIAPDGRRIVDLESDDGMLLGLREMLLETAEPSVEEVLDAYPEGTYRFIARTVEGERLTANVELTHDLPDAPVIVEPDPDDRVFVDDFILDWQAVPGVAYYIVELENESADPEQGLTCMVPAGTTRFHAPKDWMAPGSDYQAGVAAVFENGNLIVTEVAFRTRVE